MKTIYIVRHAKSSWADLTMRDIERPLNKRGNTDGPMMSKMCFDKSYIPELLITSNAQRALETSTYFKMQFGIGDSDLIINNRLYHAPEDTYFEECQVLSDEISSVMMFGHNPGITYLANSVTDNYIDNVPTCGVLVLKSNSESWMNVDPSNCKLVDFLYPKMNK